MKNMFDPYGKKVFITTCTAFAIITSAIGFHYSNFADYMGNVMSEFTGFFVGIIITILIVDMYTQHNKDKQWAKVKELTYKALNEHFIEILMNLCLNYKKSSQLKQFIEKLNNPDKSILPLFDELISEFNSTQNTEYTSFHAFMTLYNNIKPELYEIRKVLIPRIMQFSANQDIIDALVDFDNYIMELEYMFLTHKYVKEQDSCPDCVSKLLSKIKYIFTIIMS